ncbi:hypothetical protein RI129_011220 [Pyrocoelia pectoralis]|uniref:Uncharacterized protein n=1 Tax=Pyrocoelia pectoralis TaxID=417401 RepID=A0AAN7VAR8_9COLE
MHMSQEDLHSKINDIDEVYQNYATLKNNNGRLQRKYYRSLLSLKAAREECQLFKDSRVTTDQYESLVKERDELQLQLSNTKNEFNSFVNDSHIRYQSSCREVDDLNSKYNNLLTKYEELKNENKVMSELCSNSTGNDDEVHDLQISFDEKCAEIQVLQEKVTDFVGLQTKYADMQAKNDVITKERDRLDLKVQTLELELQQVIEKNRNRYATLETENDGLVKKTLNLEDTCKNLTVERDQLRNQLNDLRKRLQSSQDPLRNLLVTLRGVVEKYDNHELRNDGSDRSPKVKFPTDDCYIGNVEEKFAVLRIPEREIRKNEGLIVDDCKLIQESDFIDDLELLKIIMESTKRFKLISPIASPLHEKEDSIFDFENGKLDESLPHLQNQDSINGSVPCDGIENAIQSDLSDVLTIQNVPISSNVLNCDENENKNIISISGDIESAMVKSSCVETASCSTGGNNELQNYEISTGGVAQENWTEANLLLHPLNPKSIATPTELLKDSSEDLVKYVDHLSNESSSPVHNDDPLSPEINVNTDSEQSVITCFSNIDGEIAKDLNELSDNILENCAKINFNVNEPKNHELKLLNTENAVEKKHCDVNTVDINENNNGQMYFCNKLGETTCNGEYGELESNKKECDNRIVTNLPVDTSNICKFETPTCIDKEEIVEVFNNKLKSSVDCFSELKVGSMSESSSGFSPKVSQSESTDSAFVSNCSSSSEDEDWINGVIDDTEIFSKTSPKLVKLSKKRTSNVSRRKKKIDNEFTLGFQDDKIVTIISKSKRKPVMSRKADLLKKCTNINKISNKSIAVVTNSRKERQKHNQEQIIIEQLPCVSCARYNFLRKNRKRSFSQNVCESTSTVLDDDPQVYAKRRRIAHTAKNSETPNNIDPRKDEDGKINIISVHVIKPTQAVNSEENMLSKVTIQKSESLISPTSPVLMQQDNWMDLPVVIPTEATTMTCTNVVNARDDRIVSKLISPTIRESRSVSSPASPVLIERGNRMHLPVVIPTEIAAKPVNQENNIQSKLISPTIHKSQSVLYKLTENEMNIPPVIPSEILEVRTDYVTKPMKAVNGESKPISVSGTTQELPPAVPTQKEKMTVEKGRLLIKEMLQFCKCNEKIFQIAKLFVHQSSDFIVKLILEHVVFDIHDTPTRGYYPREPHLTTIQRGLYKFIMALEKLNVKGVCKAYFGQADLYIRTLEDPITLSPVIRLYVALCKGQFNYRQMRMAICSAFADMGDLVLPYVYIVLQMWIEVFPRKGMLAHSHILMRTIVQIILLKNISLPEYNLVNLRYLLFNYYHYSSDCEDIRVLLKELLKYYIDERNECARVLAIALLKHINVKIMVEEIFPSLQVQGTTLSDENQVCAVITLVMHFTKHCKLSSEIIATNLQWLKQFGSDLQPFIVKNHANAVLQWYMKCNSCPFNILEAEYKRCRAQACANVEEVRQYLINFPFGCLDNISEWKKCVCSDMQEVDCPGDKFNKCTKALQLRADGNEQCKDLKGDLDRLHELNFNCFCTRFLGYFTGNFCSNELDKNVGEQIHKYWGEAYKKLPPI